jgi:fumarate reductase subunit D
MTKPHRNHPLWYAYWAHRLSGLILALFLPLHFYVLSLALNGAGSLDNALRYSALPMVKFAETGLVVLLAIHLFGGIRILALEFLPWQPRQKTVAATALALAFVCGTGFLLSAA